MRGEEALLPNRSGLQAARHPALRAALLGDRVPGSQSRQEQVRAAGLQRAGPRVIRRIKELLYDEGFTIAGAKKRLEAELDSGGPKNEAGRTDATEVARATGEATAATAEPLDTAATEQIETLRQGVEEASTRAARFSICLEQARGQGRQEALEEVAPRVTIGTWRSLVAYLNGVQVVRGSNPRVPTTQI